MNKERYEEKYCERLIKSSQKLEEFSGNLYETHKDYINIITTLIKDLNDLTKVYESENNLRNSS